MELAKEIPPSLPAYNDVYEDDMLFREQVGDILDSLDVDSSPTQFEIGVDLVKDAVGRDVAKLHAMFDVVHARIVKRWCWATGPAIEFYRLLFMKMDMSILEDSAFEAQAKSGVTKAADNIIRRCVPELDLHDDWNSAQVRCVTHFIMKASKSDNSFITAQDASCFLLRMVESWNILVNSTNMTVFAEFFWNTVSKIQLLGLQDKLKGVSERIRELPNQMQLCDAQMETIRTLLQELDDASQAKSAASVTLDAGVPKIQTARGLRVFEEEVDWNCEEIARLVGRISEQMKIGAPGDLRMAAGSIVEAMLKSSNIFVLDENLMILVRFLEHIGPVIDAAKEGKSNA